MAAKRATPSIKGKHFVEVEQPTQRRLLAAANAPYVIDGLALANGIVFGTSGNALLLVDSASLQTLWQSQPARDTAFAALATGDGTSTFWSADAAALRLHDVRSSAATGVLQGPSKAPYTAIATAASGFELAAGTALAGSDAFVELWDTRSPNAPIRTYSESHSDDITSLSFHPDPPSSNLLLSSSTDGLFSVFDTRQADEDDCVLGVGQTGASLKSAGWLGQGVWALSDMMTLQLWSIDAEGPELQTDFGDLREHTLPVTWQTDYVIQCDSSNTASGTLAVHLGSANGSIASLTLSTSKPEKWSLRNVRRGGHDEIVRCVVAPTQNGPTYTGGEDGAICAWAPTQSVEQTEQKHKSARFTPYGRPG